MYAAILLVFGVLGITALTVVWRGFTLSMLWGWFMVPAFGLPHLTIPFAIGIAIVISFLTHQANLQEREQKFGDSVITAFLGPLFALFIGWIVTLFI